MDQLTNLLSPLSPRLAEGLNRWILFLAQHAERIVRQIPHLPRWEVLAWKFFDVAFAPRQILFQLVLVGILQIAAMGYETTLSASKRVLSLFSARRRRIQQLQGLMAKAQSYQEWDKYAREMDTLTGFDAWRKQDETSLIDHVVLRKRIDDLEKLMRNGDVFDLMFKLRGGLARDQFGLCHEGLFNKAMAATKDIVENYHNIVCAALNYICDAEDDDVRI
jgi:TAG lipase/steryl ester hydrolase/phospholipase A2/LPA acyltransferase